MRADPLTMSLETVIAASPMLGHMLEDRSSVRNRQEPALVDLFLEAGTVELSNPDQQHLFLVAPLDLLVIALGCNDLKQRFGLSAGDIALGAERLLLTAKASNSGPTGKPPEIILVAPPPLAALTGFAEMFQEGTEKAKLLGARYSALATMHGVGFVDAGGHIHCSPLDGIHFDSDQHALLGLAMANAVKQRLGF